MSAPRPGYALLISLLLVLALATLALGAVAVGTRERVVAATLGRTERARVLAEAAAMDAVRAWSTRRYRGLPVGGVGPTHGGVVVERVARSLFTLRADATVPGRPVPVGASAGLLVRTFDTAPIEAQLPAAASADADALLGSGVIAAGSGCGAAMGPGLVAPTVSIGSAAALTGSPPYARPGTAGLQPPDAVMDSMLAALADVRVTASSVSPRPRSVSGLCDPAADNWGSPDPADPCHGRLPLVHAAGALTLAGGRARALLLVDGPLTLDGTTFHGVVLVRGSLTLDAGARIRGAVRASRILLVDGAIQGDPCEAGDAIYAPALDRAFRPPDRWWIPMY
jgi:hypothetical protein